MFAPLSIRPLRVRGVRTALAGMAGCLAVSLLVGAPAEATTNLVVNPGFETGTTGWTVNTGTALARVKFGKSGSYSGRVTNATTAAKTTLLNDAVNTVKSTAAGETYDVSAWVRTRNPGSTIQLRVMEFAGRSTLQGQTSAQVVLPDTTWRQIKLSHPATGTGNNLDVNVFARGLVANGAFYVDGVTLTRRATTTTVASPTPTTTPTPAWRMVWNDEFSGTTLDRTKWNAENNSTYGDGNGELACLMDRPENLFVSNGALTVRARKEATPYKCKATDTRFPNGRDYTSAMLHTRGKGSWLYGKFEIRAKLPTQQHTSKGLWPAFWMRPDAGGTGELDIMEAVGSNGTNSEHTKVHQTIHYDYIKTHPKQAYTYTFPTGTTPSDGFHTYAAEWDKGEIRWYVDGKLTYTRSRSTTSWLDEAFSKPFFIRLNLAVGGSWPGSPDANTKFPADYVVDYVRVYQR